MYSKDKKKNVSIELPMFTTCLCQSAFFNSIVKVNLNMADAIDKSLRNIGTPNPHNKPNPHGFTCIFRTIRFHQPSQAAYSEEQPQHMYRMSRIRGGKLFSPNLVGHMVYN